MPRTPFSLMIDRRRGSGLTVALITFLGCGSPRAAPDVASAAPFDSAVPRDSSVLDAGSSRDVGSRIDSGVALCPALDIRTDQIELVAEADSGTLHAEFYRNRAYTCGVAGYHTFILAYPAGSALTDTRPLFLRLHGGGAGAFTAEGDYVPDRFCQRPDDGLVCQTDEETFAELAGFGMETGLMARVRADPVGYRFLIPSMCDHDLYAGIGAVEPHNPFSPDENGRARAADGLLALRAALTFARARAASGHVVAYGTSAGASGVIALLGSLGCEGRRLSAAVVDSYGGNPQRAALAEMGCGFFTVSDGELIAAKVGTFGTDAFSGPALIRAGWIDTPLYDLWSTGDGQCRCATETVTIDTPTGPRTGTGCTLWHEELDQAIDAYDPGGDSRWQSVCVDDGTTACALHTASQYDFTETGGDRSRGGADYNAPIMEWLRARLLVAPPAE